MSRLRAILTKIANPSSRALQYYFCALGLWCLTFAIIDTNLWIRLVDAFAVGMAVTSIWHIQMARRRQQAWDDLFAAYRELIEFNRALIRKSGVALLVAEASETGIAPEPPTKH